MHLGVSVIVLDAAPTASTSLLNVMGPQVVFATIMATVSVIPSNQQGYFTFASELTIRVMFTYRSI
jgi:hypothetical protein